MYYSVPFLFIQPGFSYFGKDCGITENTIDNMAVLWYNCAKCDKCINYSGD